MVRRDVSGVLRKELLAPGRRFALLVSRFNEEITEEMLEGARACLLQHEVAEADVDVFRVPGAWELPQGARALVDAAAHDAVIALGCVIRGETPHFDFVAGEAARGLGEAARSGTVPVAFGVLTTETVEQARERADRQRGDKGREAALAALEMVSVLDRIRGGR